MDSDIDKYVESYPVLGTAVKQAGTRKGISDNTLVHIIESSISNAELSDFLLALAKNEEAESCLNTAITSLEFINLLNLGYEALDYCLENECLSEFDKQVVAAKMKSLNSEKAISWCHKKMVNKICNDFQYHTFFNRHHKIILNNSYEEMVTYLLNPDRGPTQDNVYTFYEIIERVDQPEVFVERWIEWIKLGQFDYSKKERNEVSESPILLYKIFNRAVEDDIGAVTPVITVAIEHVSNLIRDKDYYKRGFYHLLSMLSARFLRSEDVVKKIYGFQEPTYWSADEKELYKSIFKAFDVLRQHLQNSNDDSLRRSFEDLWSEIYKKDKNITGFWMRR